MQYCQHPDLYLLLNVFESSYFICTGFGISASNTYPTSLMASFTSLLRNRRGDLPVAAKASCLAGQYIDVSFTGHGSGGSRICGEWCCWW